MPEDSKFVMKFWVVVVTLKKRKKIKKRSLKAYFKI